MQLGFLVGFVGFIASFIHSLICFRQIPEVLEMTFREFIRFATRPSFALFQHISQHSKMAIKSSPLLGFHHILSQIAFCLVVKFLFFKFHDPKLLYKALCFLDRGCQLLFVEYIHVLPIAQPAPVKAAEIHSIQSRSTYYSK